jgi:8-oxo-dGTP diphosphatase
MKENRPYIGVDAIIFDNPNTKVLLNKRVSKSFNGMWGLISGMIEEGETVKDALKREALEEIGVDIEIINFTGKYYDKIGRHPTKTVICLPHICKIINETPKAISECSDVRWFTAEELKDMDLAFDHKQMLEDIGFIK